MDPGQPHLKPLPASPFNPDTAHSSSTTLFTSWKSKSFLLKRPCGGVSAHVYPMLAREKYHLSTLAGAPELLYVSFGTSQHHPAWQNKPSIISTVLSSDATLAVAAHGTWSCLSLYPFYLKYLCEEAFESEPVYSGLWRVVVFKRCESWVRISWSVFVISHEKEETT